MNGLPYYKAYPRDFFDGTVGMPFDLKCAYRLVIDLIYMQGGRLPDDARYISGLLGCSVRAWNRYREELIARGKISAELGIISNFRADKELESLSSFQEKQSKNASGPRKNKDLTETVAKPKDRHTDTDTYKDKEQDARTHEREALPPEKKPGPEIGNPITDDPGDWTPDRLLDAVMAAVGLNRGTIPTYWLPPASTIHVHRWATDLGLTPDQIIDAARQSRQRHPDPPTGPKALDGVMRSLAAAIQKPALQPATTGGTHDRATRFAEHRAFEASIDRLATGLAEGTITLDTRSRDPFASRT